MTDPLLQPFQLKHLKLRNRIMVSAHEPSYAEDGMPKDRYRAYHRERAKGGVALTMTAGSAIVSPDSPPAFGNLHAYRDEIVPWMRKLVDDCHEFGAAVTIQITHLGRRTSGDQGEWLPLLSASTVREPAHRSFPKTAEDWDIDRLVADYAAAAQRMQAAGVDGLEIEAYGHFLDSFWSPATNHRDDDYGGSLDNRLRFMWRVIDAVRAACGDTFIVGTRMVADEVRPNGLNREEGIEVARRLAASGKFDFINVIRGHLDTDAELRKVIPTMGMPSAPHLDFAGEVRQACQIPVFHAARISDVATARYAIDSGKVDMVGMTRAHLADPHIVNKIIQGNEQDIRPCVGATYCLDRIYRNGEALCIHNPASGRELTMPHAISQAAAVAKKVVVVGAGPAGLEAARVCAARGHQVIVFEANDQAGGQVRLAAQLKRRQEIIGIIDWRVSQCDQHGVQWRFNQYAESDSVLAENPDVVIIATGGLPPSHFVEYGDELLTSSWSIIAGEVKPMPRVLLYDDLGDHQGMQAAEQIVQAGSQLELVTPERSLAIEMGGLNHVAYAKALQLHHAVITINRRLHRVQREADGLLVELASDYGDSIVTRTVDQVVVENGTLPLDDLYFALRAGSRNRGEVDHQALIAGREQKLAHNPDSRYQLFRIGDAVASRNIHTAVYDALRLGMTI